MSGALLRIAAAQFPVTGDSEQNLGHILRLMGTAREQGARVVQFPESALPGYAPRHHRGPQGVDWQRLGEQTDRVRRRATELGIWVVLGSTGRQEGALPTNTSVVIDPSGEIVATYAKRRLYGCEVDAYSPGDGPVVVEIEGVRCGLLICYENGFPSLFRELRGLGAELLFHSFHNAGNRGPTDIRHLMRAVLLTRAADHGLTICASNSSEPYCPMPAGIVRPDGSSVWARRHGSSVVVDDFPAELGWTFEPEP